MDRLFVDTSAWFAYANSQDPDHDRVRRVLLDYEGRLVTSNFVFDETVTLCRRKLGYGAACLVGEALRDSEVADVVRVTPQDENSAWKLFLDRDDKVYSFTDCTSFVLLRRLKLGHVLALDDDFRREGFTTLPD